MSYRNQNQFVVSSGVGQFSLRRFAGVSLALSLLAGTALLTSAATVVHAADNGAAQVATATSNAGTDAVSTTPPVNPSWSPTSSERLVKLPAIHLKKAIDRDFAQSGLAEAVRNLNGNIANKQKTLADLKGALEVAEGDVKVELRHQFLVEKQAFVRLMGERLEMQKSEIGTRSRLYAKLLDKIEREDRARGGATGELIATQMAARERFESNVAAVDVDVFGSGAEQSKYAIGYAQNREAIERLRTAIISHPMNRLPQLDGKELDRKTYVRRLLEDTQASLALLDQEEELLGFMGKLVALDAIALHEDIADLDAGLDPAAEKGAQGVAAPATVDLFVN